MEKRMHKISRGIKKVLALVLVCSIGMGLGYTTANTAQAKVSLKFKAKLNKKSITMKEGDTYNLKLKFSRLKLTGADHEKANITWISENPDVATVNSKGEVKAVSEGTTKIRVIISALDKKYVDKACKVRVKGEPTVGVEYISYSIERLESGKILISITNKHKSISIPRLDVYAIYKDSSGKELIANPGVDGRAKVATVYNIKPGETVYTTDIMSEEVNTAMSSLSFDIGDKAPYEVNKCIKGIGRKVGTSGVSIKLKNHTYKTVRATGVALLMTDEGKIVDAINVNGLIESKAVKSIKQKAVYCVDKGNKVVGDKIDFSKVKVECRGICM